MNKLLRIEWVSEWVSDWVIECHSSASESPWHDYVIHELKMKLVCTVTMASQFARPPQKKLKKPSKKSAKCSNRMALKSQSKLTKRSSTFLMWPSTSQTGATSHSWSLIINCPMSTNRATTPQHYLSFFIVLCFDNNKSSLSLGSSCRANLYANVCTVPLLA